MKHHARSRIAVAACALALAWAAGAAGQTVAIPDANLRAGLVAALGKAAGATVTATELETLTSLKLGSAGIADPSGLTFASNLVSLDLGDNAIADLAPLAGLDIERLDLRGNPISDLTPLADLPSLAELTLGDNPVTDFSPLAPLVQAGLKVHWRPAEHAAPHVVRVHIPDALTGARIVISMDALESEYEKGHVVVLASDEDLEALLRTGLRVVKDDDYPVPPVPGFQQQGPLAPERAQTTARDAVGQPSADTIADFTCYRTVEGTYASAEAIVTNHPELATWTRAGESWLKKDGDGGYDLMVLRLANEDVAGPKPRLFVASALHAREYATAELAIRFAEQLVAGYGTDADATWLLDHHEVHLMLHANPDGRKRAEQGVLWRKNHNRNHCPDDWMGVDLNRNFDFEWGGEGASAEACSQIFRGARAASEPETQAIAKYLNDLFPDARGEADTDAAPDSASGIFLDIHAHGRLMLWPWGYTSTPAPNGAQLRTLGRKLAFFNGHLPMQAIGLYLTHGTTDDYAYGELGVASYTFELGTTFFQPCDYFENTILAGNLRALRYVLKAAHAPYAIPAGPEALDVAVSAGASPAGVPAGTPVTLSATLSDKRYSDQNGVEPAQAIAAGEYYVDVPPWGENPAANAMTAADGAFDQVVEDATASVDTTEWRTGRHIVFARAQDADGHWGAVSAVFLFIDNDAGWVAVTPTRLGVVEGATATYTVVLKSKPTADVTIAATGSAPGKATVAPASHTFTPSNWSTGKTFTVTGEAPGPSTIGHAVTASTDGNYPTSLTIESVAVTVAARPIVIRPPPPPPPPPNRPPEVRQPIPTQEVAVDTVLEVDLSDHFFDPERRPLTYTAEVDDPSVATARVGADSVLTVSGVKRGVTTVTVTAIDDRDERASNTFVVAVDGPATVPYLPRAANDALAGLVRVINHSVTDGEVQVTAIDGVGMHSDAVTLRVAAGAAVSFNSWDLEQGNVGKGLMPPGVGIAGLGDWRLELASEVDIEVLSYVRTRGGGALASMHDVVPQDEEGHRVVFFNPASNVSRVSLLRLINPGEAAAEVHITGVDDAGEAGESAVVVTLGAGASRSLSARALESGEGEGLSGALGDGTGKWRLRVTADRPIRAMSLLKSMDSSDLTNVSTAHAPEGAVHRVPQLPRGSHPHRDVMIRVVNRSAEAGEVSIVAFDNAGTVYDPLTLRIEANETVHFTSADLERGSSERGLEGATGEGEGRGVWSSPARSTSMCCPTCAPGAAAHSRACTTWCPRTRRDTGWCSSTPQATWAG